MISFLLLLVNNDSAENGREFTEATVVGTAGGGNGAANEGVTANGDVVFDEGIDCIGLWPAIVVTGDETLVGNAGWGHDDGGAIKPGILAGYGRLELG